MNNQCVCFRLETILISVELSRCLYIWVVVHHHVVYIYSHLYFYIGASLAFFFFFSFLSWQWACMQVCVCRYMCNWAKTILNGDIRDGWITENLLKRDNPSCTLIRHTPWFSNGIFSIISAVTVIASSHSAQLGLSSSSNSFSLPALPPPSFLPMTLHKLRAIQVALVMLIGLGMAYAYPPSRVWALIRAKQSPAHPSYSTPAQVQTLCSVWCGPQLGPPQCWLFLMCQIVPGLVLHRQGD